MRLQAKGLQEFQLFPNLELMTERKPVNATKLREDLTGILNAVLAGDTVHVERNSRPVAVLVPPKEYARLVAAAAREGDAA